MQILSAKTLLGKVGYGLQLAALITLIVLEYLSGYKAGVMKHLYFKKMELMFSIYTDAAIFSHTVTMIVLTCLAMLQLTRLQWPLYGQRCLARLVSYGALLLFAFHSPWLQELTTYPYLLLVAEIFIIVELVKIALLRKRLWKKPVLRPANN